MTSKEVSDYVEYEGLGYAIESGMSGSSIDDPILAEKWDRATKLLQEIRSMLPEPCEDGEEEI